ncbi:unnamed protein product [Owenia fusiformis]|uniref:RING-type E3 ubiquitin transferase n=1 Tax=Owenia fusiformis TaxID=6347 RepID=A0A8S4Q2P4_OWEFU|nr:unnamed protein product [Owenia fusiformis]
MLYIDPSYAQFAGDVSQRYNHIFMHELLLGYIRGMRSDWTKVIRDNTETVPFILRDAEIPAAAGSVFITEPLQASTLQEELTPTYDVFEPNKSSLMERGLDRIFGDVSKGIQESEHMLKLGTNIVGIGEIILQGEKAVMRAPKAGGDYVLTLFSKAEIIKRFESKSLWYKVALGFLGVTGVVIFSYAIRKLYKTWQDNIQREQETQRILEARRQNRDGNEAGDGNVQECVICLTNPREVIVLNCGHICLCADCAGVLPSPRKCPICRADIARIIPTFNA